MKWKEQFLRFKLNILALLNTIRAEICFQGQKKPRILFYGSVNFCDIWQLVWWKWNEKDDFRGSNQTV